MAVYTGSLQGKSILEVQLKQTEKLRGPGLDRGSFFLPPYWEIIRKMNSSKILNAGKLEEESLVDLGDVPFPILEKIFTKMQPGDLQQQLTKVCRQIKEAAYHVIFAEYCSLRQPIESLVRSVKKEAEQTIVNNETFQDYLVLVTLLGFLQVVEAEYRAMEVILSRGRSIASSVLSFRVIRCIHQYYYLLDNYVYFQWSAFTDTNSILKPLEELNLEITADFFSNIWDIKKDPLGPMLLRVLMCAPCTTLDLIVSHRSPPSYSDSLCCIQGSCYLPDYSGACPPFLPRSRADFARELLCYVWRCVCWFNAFHVHRLRWKVLEDAEERSEQWELLGPGCPYTEDSWVMKTKKVVPGVSKRVWRSVRKLGEGLYQDQPFGIRCRMKLWCPLSEAPRELFDPEEYSILMALPPRPLTSTRQYLLTLDLRSQVPAVRASYHNVVVAAVSVEETANRFSYSYSKNLLF